MTDSIKELDELAKKAILKDRGLGIFLSVKFSDKATKEAFIKKCLKRDRTRHMLLRAQWYIEIADDMRKVRHNRPALSVIFFLSMAEYLIKEGEVNKRMRSEDAIKKFFTFISADDKKILEANFRRTLLNVRHHNLRFSSIVSILYEVRNKAVHGEDYFSFSLLNADDKEKHKDYTNFSMITEGYLGPRYKKRRQSLEISLAYEELRDIMKRTAVSAINYYLNH